MPSHNEGRYLCECHQWQYGAGRLIKATHELPRPDQTCVGWNQLPCLPGLREREDRGQSFSHRYLLPGLCCLEKVDTLSGTFCPVSSVTEYLAQRADVHHNEHA
jgi:hypothetical protein